MKKKSVLIFLFLLFFTEGFIFFGQPNKKLNQQEKCPDLAVLSFVTKNKIFIRWAPGNYDFWKSGNQYGYKIERILINDYTKNANDTSLNKKFETITQNPLKHWDKNDERWKLLIKKNKNSTLLYNFLFSTKTTNSAAQDIALGMVLKSCDLYLDIAKAHGLFFADSTFTENEIYVYRISLYNAPKNLKYTPVLITVNTKELNQPAKIKPIKAKFGNKKAYIQIETVNTGAAFSGFWIERSSDSINFSVVNKAPLVHTTTKFDETKKESIYSDSLPENDIFFYYRVRGIPYFEELSYPSNIVSGKGKVDFTEYPFIDSTTIIKNKSVRLKFRMPVKFDINRLKGFLIFRSENKKGKYLCVTKNIISKEILFYVDEQPLLTNYYKICAINTDNDSTYSLTTYAKLIDDVPPTVPTDLVGKIDSNGVVNISWKTNTEADFLGYRIYRCNSKKEQPVELTKKLLTETKFTDTLNLNTLTREIFYTLRAVDKVYNNSSYSNYCKIIKPDKIPPVSALFKKVIYTDSSIQINWQLSSSSDVVKYILLKNNLSIYNGWKIIKQWLGTDSLKNYSDTEIVIGTKYQYRIEVYDEAKNYSLVNSPSVFFNPGFAPKIKILTAEINLEKRNIELHWKYDNSNVYSYTIYKSKGNNPLRIFKTIDSKTTSFIDKELYPNNLYRYTIKATLNNGIESKMADIIEINF